MYWVSNYCLLASFLHPVISHGHTQLPSLSNNASDDSTEMLFSKEKQEIEKEKIKNEKKEKERLRKKKASMLNIAAVSALSNSINFCDAATPVGMCKYVSFTVIILNIMFEFQIEVS
jgi:hypothetical protein